MSAFSTAYHRLRSLFRRRRVEADMAEEMRFHLQQRAADLADDGLTAEEARFAAQRRFGNLGSIQESARDARGWGWLERLGKDLKLGVRQLVGSPSFTILAIFTLGLGIGVNTASFSMFNGIILKPLPYPDVPQLDRAFRSTPQNRDGHFSAADFLDFRHAVGDRAEVLAYTLGNASLADEGRPPEFALSGRVTANFLSLLRMPPQLGRDFQAGEDTPGRDHVLILSQRMWLNRFGGAPDVIGRTLRVDGEPYTIIGVLPKTFDDWRHFGSADFFRPLAFTPDQAADRSTTNLRMLLRRPPGLSQNDLTGFVANFGAHLATEFPVVNAGTSWRADLLQNSILPRGAPAMVTMWFFLSGAILLIACSNLANLLLARTMARAREFALRAALGASRVQLLRPLIAESLLLALAGGVCAALMAMWFRDYMAQVSTGANGDQVVFVLGWRVFGWAFFASLITAVTFGIAPALFALRLDVNQTLKSGGRGSVGGRGHQRFRSILIVGQFAIAMVLLATASVYIRGLHTLNSRRAGWESDNLITGTILLPAAKYPNADKIAAFHQLALDRLNTLPGVTSASLSSFTPFLSWPDVRRFIVEDRERPQPGHEPSAVVNTVSPRYFTTVGTRLLSGRAFNDRDVPSSTRVCILSQSTARALFPNVNPIGRRIAQVGAKDSNNPPWAEVVGVVADVESSVTELNPIAFQIYQPMAQEPRRLAELAVHSAGETPAAMADGIRAAMATLDPDLPIRSLQAADVAVERANYQSAIGRDIISAMAVLGLILASLGIYGIIARTMAQRASEFAISLALGASLGNITRIVLTSGVKLAIIGSAIGLLGAFGAVKVIGAAVAGAHSNNVTELVLTTILLIVVALVACWIPARRATRIDPISALRAE